MKMLDGKIEKLVLYNFLKSGLSTRQLDELLGFDSSQSKGFKSWSILKKFLIKNSDKCKLFCFGKNECNLIINEIIKSVNRNQIEIIFNNTHPKYLEKYRNIYIVTDTVEKVIVVLNGEARNVTQRFFAPLKKFINKCQYPNCLNVNLDTVHLTESRPIILMKACELGYNIKLKRYDVYNIMRKFIQTHSLSKSICFLCKKHHQELHSNEKLSRKKYKEFVKKLNVNLT